MNEEKTLEETIEAIREEHEDLEDVKAILAMSSEELDKKLEEKGFDVAGLDARLAAREAEVRREQDRAARWGWVTRLRALITFLLMLLSAAVTHVADVLSRVPPPNIPSVAYAPAPDLRQEAFEECGKMHWRACLQKLDEAAKDDPDGDKSEDVQRARAFAKKQLE